MKMLDSIKINFGKAKLWGKQHSPELLLGGAIACAVGAVAMTVVSTLKVKDKIAPQKKKIVKLKEELNDDNLIRNGEIDVQEHKHELTKVYAKTGWELTKLYTPSIVLLGTSIACMCGSHKIMRGRNMALAAAYASLSEVYNNYRSRVSDQLGKEVEDKIYNGTHKKKVVEKDENGKEVEKEIDVNENSGSQWSVLYDEHIPNFETRNPQLNLEFLSMTQRLCNQKLIANGYLFLYDVYEALGVTDWINEEQLRGSRIVGWVYDPDDKSRDNFVDFGIMDHNGNYSIEAMQSMRYHTGLWLNFNVDGDILTSKATKNFTKTYKRRY